MKTTQRAPGDTANPSQGVRIERLSDGLRRTEAGRIALALTIFHNGNTVGSGDLVLTQDEATKLWAELKSMLTPVEVDDS